MVIAYHAPLCLSCASLMVDDLPPAYSSRSNKVHLRNHVLLYSRMLKARLSSISCSLSIYPKTKRRIVTYAYPNTPETINPCSWNQLVLCSDEPVMVEFHASWCGPCKMVSRIMEEIAVEYAGRINCYKLDTNDYPQVPDSYGIERIPTVLLFWNGEQVKSITGTLPKIVYVNAIEELLADNN